MKYPCTNLKLNGGWKCFGSVEVLVQDKKAISYPAHKIFIR